MSNGTTPMPGHDPEEVAGRYPVDGGPVTIGHTPDFELDALVAAIPGPTGDDDQDDADAAGGTCGYWPVDIPGPAEMRADAARMILLAAADLSSAIAHLRAARRLLDRAAQAVQP